MSEQLTVIGICGKARSGKDTIAKILESQCGATRIALADGIRSALRDLDGMTWEFSKENDKGFRFPLQKLGSESREDLDLSDSSCFHWLSHALIKIRYASHYHQLPRNRFVIPDIRMPHEPGFIKAQVAAWGGKFILWKVNRPGEGLTGIDGAHKSETQLDSISAEVDIWNDYTTVSGLAQNIYRHIPEVWRAH